MRARLGLVWRAWRYRIHIDPAEIRFILGHVAPGGSVVDVGAHKGGYTYWLQRAVGDSGRVFAFEPQPALASALRAALACSGIRNVVVEDLAVSHRSGEAMLAIPEGSSTCGATLERRDQKRGTRLVRTVALDEYFRALGPTRIAFVKCDVEGHELSVFQGAERILREHRPTLLFECEARHRPGGVIDDVFRHLESFGYQGWFFWRGERKSLSAFQPEMQRVGRKPYVNSFLFTAGARG